MTSKTLFFQLCAHVGFVGAAKNPRDTWAQPPPLG